MLKNREGLLLFFLAENAYFVENMIFDENELRGIQESRERFLTPPSDLRLLSLVDRIRFFENWLAFEHGIFRQIEAKRVTLPHATQLPLISSMNNRMINCYLFTCENEDIVNKREFIFNIWADCLQIATLANSNRWTELKDRMVKNYPNDATTYVILAKQHVYGAQMRLQAKNPREYITQALDLVSSPRELNNLLDTLVEINVYDKRHRERSDEDMRICFREAFEFYLQWLKSRDEYYVYHKFMLAKHDYLNYKQLNDPEIAEAIDEVIKSTKYYSADILQQIQQYSCEIEAIVRMKHVDPWLESRQINNVLNRAGASDEKLVLHTNFALLLSKINRDVNETIINILTPLYHKYSNALNVASSTPFGPLHVAVLIDNLVTTEKFDTSDSRIKEIVDYALKKWPRDEIVWSSYLRKLRYQNNSGEQISLAFQKARNAVGESNKFIWAEYISYARSVVMKSFEKYQMFIDVLADAMTVVDAEFAKQLINKYQLFLVELHKKQEQPLLPCAFKRFLHAQVPPVVKQAIDNIIAIPTTKRLTDATKSQLKSLISEF